MGKTQRGVCDGTGPFEGRGPKNTRGRKRGLTKKGQSRQRRGGQ